MLGLILLTQLLPGCHEPYDGIHTLPADGEELPVLRQVAGTHSHESRAMRVVVRDAASLAQIPLQDVGVDFSEEMLLLVTLGRVTSDQYALRIDRVWRQGATLRVAIRVIPPPANAPLAIASPYCIAVVPRCDLNVSGFTPDPPQRHRSWIQSARPSGE